MGRRVTSLTAGGPKPQSSAERRVLARVMQQHLERAEGYDGSKYRAQTYEVDAIDTLYALMTDPESPRSLRRACALDLRLIARGPVAPVIHDGRTIDPEEPTEDGGTVGAYIEAARLSADGMRRLQEAVQARTPYDEWPEDLKAMVDPEMGAAFSEG